MGISGRQARFALAAAALVGAAGGLSCASVVNAQAPAPALRMDEHKITDGVYMMQNSLASGNSSFVVTDEGVLVFDVDLRSGDQVLAAIRRITDKKVRYVVISHPAGDHSTGAWHYREDKPVFIATRKQMRDLYMQEGVQFQERKAGNEPQYASYKGTELVLPDTHGWHHLPDHRGRQRTQHQRRHRLYSAEARLSDGRSAEQ
jgi:hypothetical protein